MKQFNISTAIAYANGVPHIGHAYEAIIADTIARARTLNGDSVYFQTGLDCYGKKVASTAALLNKTEQQHVDSIAEEFKRTYELLNIQYSKFIKTTDEDHKASVQAFWNKLVDAGDIYLDKYSGWYSQTDESFYTESEIETIGTLKVSKETKSQVSWIEEESYFFRLSKYQDKLTELITSGQLCIEPDSRKNEILGALKLGLKDLSVSRTSFSWGIPVPGNSKHIIYVWVDALVNYITGAGYPDLNDKWPCDVHLIGKDIIKFHAVYWPALLLSAGVSLPKKILAHGHLLSEGQKMSKSVGNVISPNDLISKFGCDGTRYGLLKKVHLGSDADITLESFKHQLNVDLANNIGNLSSRVLAIVAKHFSGEVPEFSPVNEEVSSNTLDLYQHAHQLSALNKKAWKNLNPNLILDEIIDHSSKVNVYINKHTPWSFVETDKLRAGTILLVCLESLRIIGILLQPFTPELAENLLNALGVPKEERKFCNLSKAFMITANQKTTQFKFFQRLN